MRERAEQENQEISPEEVGEKSEEEIKVKAGDAKAFYFDKGEEAFKKYLEKKGFMEERGFKKLMSPFKEEIERRGWENVSIHMEPEKRAVVKEFYSNLGDRKYLTCYIKGR